jgi:hypothetical protein
MRRDTISRSDTLELLVLWWRYESQQQHVEGYPRECPSTAGYRASRQYDTENQAFETDARGLLAQRVGHAVDSLPEPYRTALYVLARNRATGAEVWRSPRLPAHDDERAAVVADAVGMLEGLI